MQKILLFSEDTNLAAATKTSLERSLPNPIDVSFDGLGLAGQLERRNYHLLVFRFNYLGDYEMNLLTTPRDNNLHMPMMVVADRVKSQNYSRLSLLKDLHLLMAPVSDKAVVGLVRKLLTNRRVPKQIHYRYPTNQIAQIETLRSGTSLFTCMYNLSKGGAYCEFDGDDSFSIGDVVRMKVTIPDSNREHQLNAKIVWTTPKGRVSGRFGCGVKFISAKDSYSSMLSGS